MSSIDRIWADDDDDIFPMSFGVQVLGQHFLLITRLRKYLDLKQNKLNDKSDT